VSNPHNPDCQQLAEPWEPCSCGAEKAATGSAVALIREAVAGLSTGACFTCGAEPGTNIDCKGCSWVSRAEQFLSEVAP
jgi:hypothetical protein